MTREGLCRCAGYGNSIELSGRYVMLKDIVGVVSNDFLVASDQFALGYNTSCWSGGADKHIPW